MNQNKLKIVKKQILILIFSDPIIGKGILQITHSHMKSSSLYRKIHRRLAQIRGLEMLVCEQLRQLISSFFYKHLRHSKVIENLKEKERRRRRGSKNKNFIRELIMGRPREGSPFYRLRIRTFHERMP